MIGAFPTTFIHRWPFIVLVDGLTFGIHRDTVQYDAMEFIVRTTWTVTEFFVLVLVLHQASVIILIQTRNDQNPRAVSSSKYPEGNLHFALSATSKKEMIHKTKLTLANHLILHSSVD